MATFSCRVQFLDDIDPFATTNFPEPTRPPTYSFLDNVPLVNQIASIHRLLQAPHKIEECALQICSYRSGTQGDLGTYLDLESTLDEQADELEGFTEQRKNSLVLRTQLTVRVHVIVEKLLNSNGRELRRALFSLKQIFQDDKDLVHEFVNNDGLSCLIKVGSVSDANYQNYILRAMGQVLLYVDGMEGVIQHNPTVQWLYALLASKGRLVVKTALKLLLVFVEYTESNTVQLIKAVDIFDSRRGLHPWTNVVSLLSEKDGADSELLLYTMTLINKVISAIPDQDMFYDLTDTLEELGMDTISRWHMNRQGANLDLLTQFQLYESALMHEDADNSSGITQAENLRQVPRKKSEGHVRKSKRHEGSQEIGITEISQSQSTAPEAPRRRKRDQKKPLESLPSELPPTNENASSLNDINQHIAPEKISTTSQPEISTTSPQNSRTHRRNRQLSFIEEKHELQSLIDKQEQQEKEEQSKLTFQTTDFNVKPRYGLPTPYIQTEITPKSHIRSEPLEPSLSNSPLVFSNRSSSQTYLSGSEHVDGRLISPSDSLSKSSSLPDFDQAEVVGNKYLPNLRNEQLYKIGKSPELQQMISAFNRKQEMLDTATPHLSDSAIAQPAISGQSVKLPIQNFDNQIPNENNIPRFMSNDSSYLSNSQHQSQHHRPHHPHFHNHYHQTSLENNTLDQDFPVLDKAHSFDDSNILRKEPSTDIYSESRSHSIPEGEYPFPLEARRGAQNYPGSDSTPIYSNTKPDEYKQAYLNEDFVPERLQTTVENGLLATGEGQVRGILYKLKNEQIEIPRAALRPVGDISGIISSARDNLNRQNSPKPIPALILEAEPEKKGESDFQWDRIQRGLRRQLKVKDMDFSDLKDEDDVDILSTSTFLDGSVSPSYNSIPPPPPLTADLYPPPPPSSILSPLIPASGRFLYPSSPSSLPPPLGANLQKNKKTVRLHWRPLPGDIQHPTTKVGVIWKDLVPITIDTEKLEHLFETRTTEVKTKDTKLDTSGKKEITILDPKRSNAINIGLTVLPPPRSIKTAILKMDNSIMNKEGIEKILTTMIPTEEEKSKILEAQMANPDIPLGTAEQFLLTLSTIFELEARLKLWLFKLDFEVSEQELAEPLMDLKKGIAELQKNKTFRCILSGVLTIGNFLNGAAVHAFNVDFLQRLPEIKDTVRKHSLIHHLCTLIIEQFPDTTDLYSEIGPITRCSRVDWDELAQKLNKMESDCKASWDHLQAIVKHDGSSTDLKEKMSLFLTDVAERLMILRTVFKRVLNRYNKLLFFLGFPVTDAREMKVNHFCKVISEFALEYRTTREKVIQMIQKKANQRERKKTRGKMIVDTEKFRGKDKSHDDALNVILNNGYSGAEEGGLPGQRHRRQRDSRSVGSRAGITTDSDMGDTGEDEILEACFRTATASSSRAQRDRKRSGHQRKSLRRTLKGGLVADEIKVVQKLSDHM